MHNANRPTLSPPSSTCAHWLREATCAAALALALAGLFPGTASAAYILALESDADRTENEVFFLSYSTFEDLVANTNGSGTFGAANISSLFSVGGFAYVPPMQPPPPPPPVEVPEPGILTLLAAGLLGIRMKGWRRRRATIETFGPRGDKV